jgi:D-sedoheptulose 7-phosphate isomerase
MQEERVYELFKQSVEAKMELGESLLGPTAAAGTKLADALLNGNKILVCGNAASAAIAQIFTSAMLDRFEQERPSLPAIWLGSNVATYTAISSGIGIAEVFSKPIRALGNEGDVLVTISSSGNSPNLVQAVGAAHDRGVSVIALTGRDGGNIASLIDTDDIELRVNINSRARIHEIHLLIIFCLCDLIDAQIFGMDK